VLTFANRLSIDWVDIGCAPIGEIGWSVAAWGSAIATANVPCAMGPGTIIAGAPLNHYSIQVGVGRALIRRYAEDWLVGLIHLSSECQDAGEWRPSSLPVTSGSRHESECDLGQCGVRRRSLTRRQWHR
jgi:hypothetical protein